jgi:hypothetical protein
MTLWTLSLVLALLVTLIVALLLHAITRQAEDIRDSAVRIWEGGTRIANNTVHVPDLARSNGFSERILGQLPAIDRQLERIRRHARECPGCPGCMAGGGA